MDIHEETESPVLKPKNLLELYPDAFSAGVKAFFGDASKRATDTVMVTRSESGEREVWFVEYLIAKCPIAREAEGVQKLGKLLGLLYDEGILLGYLSPPGALELLDDPKRFEREMLESIRNDLPLPEIDFGPKTNEALYAFVAIRADFSDLQARFPEWVQCEGNIGPELELP
jgi:hypothetical protein